MKRIIILVSLISFGLTLTSNNAQAQGCATPTDGEGVQVFGYIQPELNTYFEDETKMEFQFRRARIGVMGVVPYDFSYYVLLETSQWLNPNGTGPFLLDAFVSYTRFDYFKISLGSFKYRFGNELSQACNALYTVRRSKTVDELTANFNGGNRDLGLMFLGGNSSTFIQYYASITNGFGVLDTENNNLLDAYALTGRVVFQPITGLYIGASGRYMTKPSDADGVTTNDLKDRIGFDVQYKIRNLTLIGEYINGKDEGSYLEGGGCDGTPVTKTGFKNAQGFFGMAIYRMGNFEPVYKFENYITEKGEEGVSSTTDESSFCHTFGLNFYPNDWTRIQANYIYASEDPLEIKNDALMIQLQINF